MAHADDIQHYCHMIAVYSDIHNMEINRYLVVLEKIAQDGGFATKETEEINQLKNTAEELRALADRIDLVKESLEFNSRRKHAGEKE